jgi:hypothetical protein
VALVRHFAFSITSRLALLWLLQSVAVFGQEPVEVHDSVESSSFEVEDDNPVQLTYYARPILLASLDTHAFELRGKLSDHTSYNLLYDYYSSDKDEVLNIFGGSYQYFLTETLFVQAGLGLGHYLERYREAVGQSRYEGKIYYGGGTLEQYKILALLGIGQQWQIRQFVLGLYYIGYYGEIYGSNPTFHDDDVGVSDDVKKVSKKDIATNFPRFLELSMGVTF